MLTKIKMTNEEFKLFQDYIYQLTGIYFSDTQKYSLETKLQSRLFENRLDNFSDYYNLLKFSLKKRTEMNSFYNAITINETYFFREQPQLDSFKNVVLKEIAERKKNKHLKIWSAACSTGEELYTLSILIRESLYIDSRWTVELYGTDLSPKAVERAKEGVYREISFRTTDSVSRLKYFSKRKDNTYAINPEFKKNCWFSVENLSEKSLYSRFRNVDVVFCRNVLIYFDDKSKKMVVENIYKSLAQNGYLFISQTESLFKITNLFKLKAVSGALMYLK